MTYFTSDRHFGHANIIRFCQQQFGSVEEMNVAMVAKWNARACLPTTVVNGHASMSGEIGRVTRPA